jgi:hypothetical protein
MSSLAVRTQEALAVPLASLPARCNPGYVLLRLASELQPARVLTREDAPALAAAAAAAAAAGLPQRAQPAAEAVAAYAAGAAAESPPINAVLGGVLAQEVLKAISGSGAPVHNFFFFDTRSNAGAIQLIGCPAGV